MVKLDLERMLETLLQTVRRRKREKAIMTPSHKSKEAEVSQELESSYGLFTEGVLLWVYQKTMDLAVTVIEIMMDYVKKAILKIADAVEYFYQDFKVQCAALEALVEFLTSRLGFQLEM